MTKTVEDFRSRAQAIYLAAVAGSVTSLGGGGGTEVIAQGLLDAYNSGRLDEQESKKRKR